MSKQINGKMIEVPNMYRSHNTNYIQIIGLVLLNIISHYKSYKVKRCLSITETICHPKQFWGIPCQLPYDHMTVRNFRWDVDWIFIFNATGSPESCL